MCGLVGVLSSVLTHQELMTFSDLMTIAQVRGEDGSGAMAAYVSGSKAPRFVRGEMTSSELVRTPQYREMVKDSTSCVCGHARFPTAGGYTVDDAHPFVCNQLIGMHNGTFDEIDGEKDFGDKSDTKFFYEKAAVLGIPNVIKNSIGAYCLVWFDKMKGTVNFLRNSERPLYFGWYEKDAQTMFWASERGMLQFSMRRRRPGNKIEYYELPPDQLVEFRMNPMAKITIVNQTELKSKPRPVKQVATILPFSEMPRIIDQTGAGGKGPKWVTLRGVHKGKMRHTTLRFDELKVALQVVGCNACKTAASLADYHTGGLFWFSQTEFLCKECYLNAPIDRQWAEHAHTKNVASLDDSPAPVFVTPDNDKTLALPSKENSVGVNKKEHDEVIQKLQQAIRGPAKGKDGVSP